MTDLQDARPENSGPASDAMEAEAAAESAAGDILDQPAAEAPPQIEAKVAQGSEGGQESESAEPPAKLERLQKILAQAGIASRRHAEELIEQGRVQVNGAVITTLGSKADPSRDHIRVDGKLLKGAERLRYFVMNKPKGFVTTVSDPEGRPTVMQFFQKMRERLYPIGRLDYLSEGLLLVTNDGDLANKLTKAASGVEKTYLVKVSGQPDEDSLDRLRAGVAIDRGRPGTGQVHTAPARIRLVRQADNPWYEVVLIEGRNRELRKMFEEIGHHVEKIRRVGYGPLVLDLEPGKMRELDTDELDQLRKTADGKLIQKRAKEGHRRKAMEAQLPTVAPKRGRAEASERGVRRAEEGGTREPRPKSKFGGRPQRPADKRGWGNDRRENQGGIRRTAGPEGKRWAFGGERRPDAGRSSGTRPAWKKSGDRPPLQRRGTAPREGEERSGIEKPRPSRQVTGRDGERRAYGGERRSDTGRSSGTRPAWKKPGDRPPLQRKGEARRDGEERSRFERPRPPRQQRDEFSGDRKSGRGASEYRPKGRLESSGPRRDARANSGAPRSERPRFDRPQRRGGFRREESGASSGGRDARDRGSAPRSPGKSSGWKPRAESRNQRRNESGQRPRPGSGSTSRPRGSRPGGSRPGGSRPGGSRPGGKRSGGSFRRKERE